jgi:hypothetical protein
MSPNPAKPTPQAERRRALILPREHGAWGILLVPLVTGATVGFLRGGRFLPALLFTIAVIALFWLRTPLESLLGTSVVRAQTPQEFQLVRRILVPLSAVALTALSVLFWRGSNLKLFWLALAAMAAFALQQVLIRIGRSARMAAQVAGALGLTSTAPAAYYVVTGRLDLTAAALWLANWLFAGDQIHFVALRIHAARAAGLRQKVAAGWTFLLGQFLLAVILALTSHLHILPRWTPLAFALVFFRGLAWFVARPQPIAVRRLGWTELLHAIAFAILLIASFQLGL